MRRIKDGASRVTPTICIVSLEAAVPAAPGGGSGKLVFEGQEAKSPDPVVVKAIARASVWFKHLTAGKLQSMAEIALTENITDSFSCSRLTNSHRRVSRAQIGANSGQVRDEQRRTSSGMCWPQEQR